MNHDGYHDKWMDYDRPTEGADSDGGVVAIILWLLSLFFVIDAMPHDEMLGFIFSFVLYYAVFVPIGIYSVDLYRKIRKSSRH